MLLVYLDNFIGHHYYFDLTCAFLDQELTIENLPPTTSQNVRKLFTFVMFINPVFNEIREAFLEQADQILDFLDLRTLFLLEHFGYDF